MTRTKNTFVFDASTTELVQKVQENGWVNLLLVDVPNFTNAITATVTIKDPDGYSLWTKAAIAKNAVAKYGAGPDAAVYGSYPIGYDYTITVTLSGAAGGTGGNLSVLQYMSTESGGNR